MQTVKSDTPKPIFSLSSLSIDHEIRSKNKHPVVFLHGNSQNKTCGRGLLKFFADRDHTTLSYDMPGHGDSSYNDEEYCFTDLIDLNAQVLSHFNIDSPILCGHSLGGMIQAGYAAKYQIQSASLVMCGSLDANPTYLGERYLGVDKAKLLADALDDYMEDGFKLFKRQKTYDYFENSQIDDEIINIINRRYSNPTVSKTNLQTLASFDVRQKIIDLNIPVLTLHGEQEQVIHADLVRAMGKDYSNIRQKWYPDGGHLAFYQQTALTDQYLDQSYSFLLDENTLNSKITVIPAVL